MVLRARYKLEDDKADQAIIEITEDGQVFQAATWSDTRAACTEIGTETRI